MAMNSIDSNSTLLDGHDRGPAKVTVDLGKMTYSKNNAEDQANASPKSVDSSSQITSKIQLLLSISTSMYSSLDKHNSHLKDEHSYATATHWPFPQNAAK